MHVLIIEDHRDVASGLFDFLEAKGHSVDVAGISFTGRNPAMVSQYDAIVLDVVSPGIEGVALCRTLREKCCTATPILMISERDKLDDKIAGLEAGADDYLVKPVSMNEIESRLRVLFRLGARTKMRIG